MRKFLIAIAIAATSVPVAQTALPNTWLSAKEMRCLVDNVYHEAKGESFRGMVLVAATTLNRVKHEDYPDSVCAVVYQPYQFSWTLRKPNVNRNSITYFKAWQAAWASRYYKYDAIYFHATYVKPKWAKAKQRIEQEGNHVFYK